MAVNGVTAIEVRIGVGLLLMVITKVFVSVPALLVALIETLEVPATVGVPEISPEEVLTVNPLGNPAALKLVGELVAAIW